MSATIEIDNLRVGMFVHLDLGWWAHPFALSSFLVSSPEQIVTIRRLGVKRVRWSPEKSRLIETPSGHLVPEPELLGPAETAPPEDPQARHRAELAAQHAATRQAEHQYAEAGRAWKDATDKVLAQPQLARETTEGLTRALLDKMLVDGELCIRVLAEAHADRSTAHALNVAVVSLLMGRVFGFSEAEMLDMGVGALLHDIGKLDLPDRVRYHDPQFSQAETSLYREHVGHGVEQGRRMGLSAGALLVVAQHHEMADGSGFPQHLNLERMAAAARIVSLVNRYDNLCNPLLPSQALTPHEALSLIFAQAKNKFDATMLNAFIRMMGVYPPGSLVQLTDDRYGLVVSVNSSRPLKPRVMVCDPKVPAEDALLLNLESAPDLGIRRSLKPAQLPPAAAEYLSPRPRVVYFFEAAPAHAHDTAEGYAA